MPGADYLIGSCLCPTLSDTFKDKTLALCLKHHKWDQNLWFLPVSGSTNIHVIFMLRNVPTGETVLPFVAGRCQFWDTWKIFDLLFTSAYKPWGPFLQSPDNFSGPKSNIQIEIKRIRARVLASKLLHFVSLTDSFIMLDAKLLKPRSLMETETAYRAR